MVIPLRLAGFGSRIFSVGTNEEIRMRKSRFSDAQIMGILRQVEGGLGVRGTGVRGTRYLFVYG